ncbi:tetratricopeptide repeat protein [Coriobacteriia bacterium Es71-Z0120]|uniref:CheR family methyltransferase n=1 Tax=Parvivirga hydrogeniphila TaxID=2939460 RepID=UPI002260CF1C|nr:CheR family methyltransferase [Parvivirga hydrogeniphila]MCL4078746.1 tetratricopeptide repeat protein [Parvivirga hydrogeniphila]
MSEWSGSKDLTYEEFVRFRDFIHAVSGIYMEDLKQDSLRISLVTRATRLGLSSFDEYFSVLERDEHELNELLNLVTINETSFFRFPQQFEALRTRVLPEIMANKPDTNKTIRVWSAGCSTGEEPYSIAMTLIDAGIISLGWRVQILGTDVSTRALSVAKKGEYPKRSLLNVPSEVIARHFEPVPNGYAVAPHVRSLVDFGYHNLIKEPYPLALMGNWDIIFCRNVTIYFKLESTKRVVANFYNSLNEGGYLFIGHSETLSQINDQFEAVEIGGVFLYRKPKARRGVGLSSRRPSAPAAPPVEPVVPKPERPQRAAERRTEHAASRRTQGTTKRPSGSEARRPARSASTSPGSNTDAVAAARRALEEGRIAEALELAHRAVGEDANNAEAHLIAAHVHADAGDYDAALESCHRALAINPLLPSARYILGIIYQRQGDAVRAISEFKKTVYIDDTFALAHLNLANIYKSQRKWDMAAKEYENALKALYKNPEGAWTEFLGGFKLDLLAKTCERSLLECRKAMGVA